jgi:hypothetical protein
MTSSRREFLKTARLVAGAVALPPWALDTEAAEAAAVNKSNLANAALLTEEAWCHLRRHSHQSLPL